MEQERRETEQQFAAQGFPSMDPGGSAMSLPDSLNSHAAWGKMLFGEQGCINCHSVDGTNGVGPSLLGVYGTSRPLEPDSSLVVADTIYLREAILAPYERITYGYAPVQPPYGDLNGEQVQALIEYMTCLGEMSSEKVGCIGL